LSHPLDILMAVDGSDESMAAFHYLVNDVLQRERDTRIDVLHIYDNSKDYLPPAYRKDHIFSQVESELISSVLSHRYKFSWQEKKEPAGEMICTHIKQSNSNFVCMGFRGLKRKDRMLASNVYEVLQHGRCSLIIFKESPSRLSIGRPTKFVVSASLNKSSTKAFLDALQLSKPGDEVHVVYVNTDPQSKYAAQLREHYRSFFDGLDHGDNEVYHKFHDRQTQFHILIRQEGESISQSVVRYADSIDADFIAVGTNALRVERGKTPIGSVSLQICTETETNIVISSWVDVSPRVYDANVRH